MGGSTVHLLISAATSFLSSTHSSLSFHLSSFICLLYRLISLLYLNLLLDAGTTRRSLATLARGGLLRQGRGHGGLLQRRRGVDAGVAASRDAGGARTRWPPVVPARCGHGRGVDVAASRGIGGARTRARRPPAVPEVCRRGRGRLLRDADGVAGVVRLGGAATTGADRKSVV